MAEARTAGLGGRRRAIGIAIAVALLTALLVLWLGPFLISPGGGELPGADAQAVELVENTGYRPWFTPAFEPGPATEARIFALQAALGAGVLAYVLVRLRARQRETPDEPAGDEA